MSNKQQYNDRAIRDSIAKRDRDRAAFKASHVSKHERDRQRRIIMVAVAVSGNFDTEGSKQ